MSETLPAKVDPEELNPGSFNEFVNNGYYESHTEAVNAHADQLQTYRLALATERGIDLDELHSNPQ